MSTTGQTELATQSRVVPRLNERQIRTMARAVAEGTITRDWNMAAFEVANDTAGRNQRGLAELGRLKLTGKGRAVRPFPRAELNESPLTAEVWRE